MNILMLRMLNAYTDDDVETYFRRAGINIVSENTYSYKSMDMYDNEPLEKRVRQLLDNGNYDAVYTANFFPVVARVCHEKEVVYISWQYDTPPNLASQQEMDHPTNRIFFFCRKDFEHYKSLGIGNIYYLPLAVNTERLDGTIHEHDGYSTDISLVGRLYHSTYPAIRNNMNDYDAGWFDGLVDVQRNIQSSFFLDEIITDERMESVNKYFVSETGPGISVTGRQMTYSVSTYLTYLDRMVLLNMLSKKHKTDLYCDKTEAEDKRFLEDVSIHGYVNYYTQMPLVFYNSKINLCPIIRSNQWGVPLRAIDVMGSKGFLMITRVPGVDEAFEDGREAVMYGCIEEAVDLAQYYLEHDDERKAIIQRGREKIERDYRYEDRIKAMLDAV